MQDERLREAMRNRMRELRLAINHLCLMLESSESAANYSVPNGATRTHLQMIQDALHCAGRPLTVNEISTITRIEPGSVRAVLYANDGGTFRKSHLSPRRVVWSLVQNPESAHESTQEALMA